MEEVETRKATPNHTKAVVIEDIHTSKLSKKWKPKKHLAGGLMFKDSGDILNVYLQIHNN